MADMLASYRERVAGTNIDPASLLSTDYFNLFNSVIMLFGMLPDAPDLLEEIEGWQFLSYVEHFRASGLGFAELAIEAYPFAPASLRAQFERRSANMRDLIIAARAELRELLAAGDTDRFGLAALDVSRRLQAMADEGAAIVHGHDLALDQSAIDKLF